MAEETNNIALTGVKEILSKLNDEELFNLANTVTNHLLKKKVNSTKDAIDAIIRYSPTTTSILHRRAITRDVLFSYLHDHNVPVTLPALKEKLIQCICIFWKVPLDNDNIGPPSTMKEITEEEEEQAAEVNLMAQKFCEWYYALMNQNECIGSEHFFPDACLELNLISNDSVSSNVETPQEIVKVLFQTKSDHNLYFNPNLNGEGVQGRIDKHGLVMIVICGTLHSNNTCSGIFEQVFALARDPLCENNWKIKNTLLNLRNKGDISKVPTLLEQDFTANILALPGS